MARVAAAVLLCLLGAAFVAGSEMPRRALLAPAPVPNYAPAPTAQINGVSGYSCPNPGTAGYRFQPQPCTFGPNAGATVYCDLSTEGTGLVGIRNDRAERCVDTTGCPSGSFCDATYSPARCTVAATELCFAGAAAPAPAPVPTRG